MKVNVLFFANIKQQVGESELVVELDSEEACSFSELLLEINRLISPQLCSFDSRTGNSIPIRVAVNGTLIHALNQPDRKILDGDTVTISPLLSAG